MREMGKVDRIRGGGIRREVQVGEAGAMKWDNTDAAGRGSHHRMLMRGWRLLGQWTLPVEWCAVVGGSA